MITWTCQSIRPILQYSPCLNNGLFTKKKKKQLIHHFLEVHVKKFSHGNWRRKATERIPTSEIPPQKKKHFPSLGDIYSPFSLSHPHQIPTNLQ